MTSQRFRPVLALLALALTGCPATSDPIDGPGDGDSDGDGDGDCVPIDHCAMTFRYPAAGVNSAELRGSFDGWGNGVTMRREDGFWVADLDVTDGQRVEYKFLINGTIWIEDPAAISNVDDGSGGKNSVVVNDCGGCEVAGEFDWQDGIMYFVFVDRFVDGDSRNNEPLDNVSFEANYQGGDLAGVLDKIEDGYFTDLGVNVLWLTAPIENADGIGVGRDGRSYSAYHGYWPTELDRVEARVGTTDDLRAVVDAAHARGIRIVLDYVMNHVHTESSVFRDHPDWFWPLDKPGGGICQCGNGCDWGGSDGLRCWFEPYLADFNFTNPAARSFSVDNAVKWITDTGIDGYRLDAVKHIETQWIVDLRSRLGAELEPGRTPFYMVGETFDGDRGLIGSYVDPDTMLDGQFDFPLRANLISMILRREGSMSDLAAFLESNDSFYHPRSVMGTFIGNHDLPRAVHIAEDFSQFTPWDSGSGRGWDNRPTLPDYAAPFERLGVAYAFLMTTHGMPLIYYGDEVGMAGGGDPDNRRPMQWAGLSSDQEQLRALISRLTKIRGEHPVLRRGYRNPLATTFDTMVYEMREATADEVIVVALNRSDSELPGDGIPSGSYTDLHTGQPVTAPIELPPRSALILLRAP